MGNSYVCWFYERFHKFSTISSDIGSRSNLLNFLYYVQIYSWYILVNSLKLYAA